MLVVAGEVSGDMHAAKVIGALLDKDPSIHCWGIGGDELRACGVEILHDVREMAVMGLSEVLRKYGFFKRVFREMLEAVRERKPDAAMLVDYPGFNLRLAEELHAMGIKVIYYICPQVWAWHRSRIQKMARIVDRLLVIFPFEVDVFAGTGLQVDFVGHPLIDEAKQTRSAPAEPLPWGTELGVALLPGSRAQEVRRILPPMWAAATALEKEAPDVSFVVAAPTEQIAEVAREVIGRQTRTPTRVRVVVGKTREVLRQARAAMVASGTATIEAALMRCPMVIVYRAAWLTWMLGRMLVKVPHIGMVNIVAGRALCPEFIQGGATPGALVKAIVPLLSATREYEDMTVGLQSVVDALGQGGGATQAADVIQQELG